MLNAGAPQLMQHAVCPLAVARSFGAVDFDKGDNQDQYLPARAADANLLFLVIFVSRG